MSLKDSSFLWATVHSSLRLLSQPAPSGNNATLEFGDVGIKSDCGGVEKSKILSSALAVGDLSSLHLVGTQFSSLGWLHNLFRFLQRLSLFLVLASCAFAFGVLGLGRMLVLSEETGYDICILRKVKWISPEGVNSLSY